MEGAAAALDRHPDSLGLPMARAAVGGKAVVAVCQETFDLENSGGWLECDRPGVGHDWHYDSRDMVYWREDEPKEVSTDAAG